MYATRIAEGDMLAAVCSAEREAASGAGRRGTGGAPRERMPRELSRVNVLLDDEHAAKLYSLASRTYVNLGTIARSAAGSSPLTTDR
jgi:hypothetical protein